MAVKNRLLEIRLKMGLEQGRDVSQTELAKLIGVPRSDYSRYERQERQPSIEVAMKIVKALRLPIDDIFYFDPPEK